MKERERGGRREREGEKDVEKDGGERETRRET